MTLRVAAWDSRFEVTFWFMASCSLSSQMSCHTRTSSLSMVGLVDNLDERAALVVRDRLMLPGEASTAKHDALDSFGLLLIVVSVGAAAFLAVSVMACWVETRVHFGQYKRYGPTRTQHFV